MKKSALSEPKRLNRSTKLPLLLILFVLYLPGCLPGNTSEPGEVRPTSAHELTVFAAASLSEAMTEMVNAFEAEHKGVNIILNLAGSQQLAQQLVSGAPADVFASANYLQLSIAKSAGRISAPHHVLAKNRLVVILPMENPGNIRTLEDMARPGLKLLLAAPGVPAGDYTNEYLQKASQLLGLNYQNSVLANTVSQEQSVRAVLTKIMLGEADAGIVYASDLSSLEKHDLLAIPIPDSLNIEAEYPIAPISDSTHPELARSFVDFARSSTGMTILMRHGFIAPNVL